MRFAVLTLTLFATPLAFAQPTVASTTESLALAQRQFRACHSGKLQLEFAPALSRLEAARKQLEKGRRQTEARRRSLEVARKRIEAAHQSRHETLAERDAKERHYQEALATGYTTPMQQLAPLMAAYASGLQAYVDVLERYSTFCSSPEVTTQSARAFVATLTPAVDALATTSTEFLATTSAAEGGDVVRR